MYGLPQIMAGIFDQASFKDDMSGPDNSFQANMLLSPQNKPITFHFLSPVNIIFAVQFFYPTNYAYKTFTVRF